MFRLTLKNLLANKVRFALTTFGVMLAVSFVVSAFVLGDGLRSSFTNVSEDVTAGVDLEVRNVADFGDAPPLTAGHGRHRRRGRRRRRRRRQHRSRPTTRSARSGPTATRSRPTARRSWRSTGSTTQQLSAFTLVDGAPPAGRRVHDGRRLRRQARLRDRRHVRAS